MSCGASHILESLPFPVLFPPTVTFLSPSKFSNLHPSLLPWPLALLCLWPLPQLILFQNDDIQITVLDLNSVLSF